MLKPIQMRANRKLLRGDARDRAVETRKGLTLSWGAEGGRGKGQAAYRARLKTDGREIWDSGWTETVLQECEVPLDALAPAAGARPVEWALRLRDDEGEESAEAREVFYCADADWTAKWIASPVDDLERTVLFRRDFTLTKPVRRAVLYACGLGYHELTLNGARVDAARMDPAHTDYSRVRQYVVWPEAQGLLREGKNCVAAKVGGGWRDNPGRYQKNLRDVAFFGKRQLICMLDVEFEDGTTERIETDRNWRVGYGAEKKSCLFDGSEYDARLDSPDWMKPDFPGFLTAEVLDDGTETLTPMQIPPVREMGVYRPVSVSRLNENAQIVDFGQNLSGVIRLKLPKLSAGQQISVFHAEELDENGDLYTLPLRGAAATDRYIASGDGRDLAVWEPSFTYHGFRYARVEGLEIGFDDIEAVLLHTDLENESRFTCGSAAMNALQRQILMTERDNMHSILTDCPQRDERMGWMNDATVRFEETPYNFDCAGMFRKIVRDLLSIQREDGAIACTCPKLYGSFPADPVCSSFLMAGWMAYLHFGDAETLREGYDGFRAWENCLLSHSENYIVNYSYYGDWAAPAYACEGDPVNGAKSGVTPGEFMSTGYSYWNCRTLSEMARALHKDEDVRRYSLLAGNIRKAMLDKWYCAETATFATGSMGCQAFSLWLGIVPENDRARAAAKMRNDLVNAGYAFTTGNLCTRYLLDMLAEYGYADDAYELLTRDEYPSWGFMRQNEATTVWERFELKKDPGMNSHNHPMYGAAGSFLYSHLAGIRPIEAGYRRFAVRPYLPKKLLSAQAAVDTPRGRIHVRWTKRYGQAVLSVDVPFGCVCETEFFGEKRVWTRGSYRVSVPLQD